MNLRDNENIWVLGGFLGATALVSGLVLALVFTVTRGPVEKMQQQTLRNSLQMLALPEFDNAPDREVKQFASPAGYPVYIMPVRSAVLPTKNSGIRQLMSLKTSNITSPQSNAGAQVSPIHPGRTPQKYFFSSPGELTASKFL